MNPYSINLQSFHLPPEDAVTPDSLPSPPDCEAPYHHPYRQRSLQALPSQPGVTPDPSTPMPHPPSSNPILFSLPSPHQAICPASPPILPVTRPASPLSLASPFSPSLLQSQYSEDQVSPDLECAVCFSQFNNVFRCPKMLQCKHTFCLECLARINVKSLHPDTIQCPLCRGLTPLPSLGLPKLDTDPAVLSYLPAAMQKVYSIRFNRTKGKLQVKRSSERPRRWGQRPRTSLRSVSHSLDVGIPSPTLGGSRSGEGDEEEGGVGGFLFRLTDRPVCRAVLLTSVVLMTVLLTGIVIFLLFYKNK
ncbi:RING finger protein 223 [Merluccius polli]|uniref:RING finger protein 223 n=1 Tax=Merluccius polli TaxID=89951 RepID=A0AA47NDG9_MERPO|nr:RING finger protein 223 [Merluccius polli]